MKSSSPTKVAYAAIVLLCSALAATPNLAAAQSPDNSGQNKRQTATADNQSNAKADRLMTAQVRKAIMADKDLSTYGHNVKILTTNGLITLKGLVKSEEEKQKIASDVANVVSPEKIINQLTVKE